MIDHDEMTATRSLDLLLDAARAADADHGYTVAMETARAIARETSHMLLALEAENHRSAA